MNGQVTTFSLPLDQSVTLDLPEGILRHFAGDNPNLAMIAREVWGVTEKNWFVDFLSENSKVEHLALRDGEWFVGLVGRENSRGCVYLPVRPDRKVLELRTCVESARDALTLLAGSFDSLDIEFDHFLRLGSPAQNFVDFSRHLGNSEYWFDSVAFYGSPYGDTLLMRADGLVAWHKIETNEILPDGDFEASVKLYFQKCWAGLDYSPPN